MKFWTEWTALFKKQKTQLVTACIAVFIWGLIAHAYGLLNLTISHDSLNEFFASSGDILHRVKLGRFMVPVYQFIFHGRVSLPWLNGLLSLCWLSISVWLITYIFSISDKIQIILIAGIFTVNITVTALTATYIHDLDADMFAVMLSVYMVFLWYKGGKKSWIGIPLLVMVLGFYQSILSVAITLIMICSILSLLQGENASKVVLKGLQAIGIIFIAGVIYLLAVKISCLITGAELSTDYNGLTNLFEPKGGVWQYFKLILITYYEWLMVFSRSSRSIYETFILHILLAIPVIASVIHAIGRKKLPISSRILVLILGALLPLGMNISCVADGGMVHDLMLYAVWLIYLLAILMTEWYATSSPKSKKFPKLCYVAVCAVLFLILITDVQTANSAYVKKDLERQATLSVMSTVNAEMNMADDYVAGKTKVAFVGTPPTGINKIFPNLTHITGLGSKAPITYVETYNSYFQFILQTPLLQSKEDVPKSFTDNMKAFPEQGYIQWYDDVLVVKLSD